MIAEESDILRQIRTDLPQVQQVLVFAPHPDDEIFGCGGTLALFRQQGTEVKVIIVTDGAFGTGDDATDLIRLRADESRAAATVLGLNEPTFWGLPDRGLLYGELLISRLMATIKESAAQLVLLPAPTELHPDHQALALAGAEAVRRLGGHLQAAFYEINRPLPNPNLLLDISGVFEQKQTAMACFVSQLAEQPYEQRISGLNKIRSYFLGADVLAAEAFLLLSAEQLAVGLGQLFDGPLAHRQKLGFAASPADLPLVSIIVRSMDRPTLTRALDSLALQTWPNLEVIVVNAKGGEHSPLPQTCGNFPLHLQNQNGQPLLRSLAANMGLAACNGQYIGFLDDDDTVDADHLQRLVTALRSADARLAYSGVRGVTVEGDKLQAVMEFKEPGVTFARLLMGNALPIHSVLFSRELLQQGAAFDEQLDLYEDWDFWLQLTRQTIPLFVDRITASYYTGGTSAVGVGDDGDTALKQRLRVALFTKWLAQLTVAEFDAIGDLYHGAREEHYVQLRSIAQTYAEEKNKLQQELAAQSNQLVNLQQQLAAREQLIANVYASNSWRVTAPLRWVSELLRRFKQSPRGDAASD